MEHEIMMPNYWRRIVYTKIIKIPGLELPRSRFLALSKVRLVAQQNRTKKKKNGALKKTQARAFTAIGLVEGIPYPAPQKKFTGPSKIYYSFNAAPLSKSEWENFLS